ncbi:MAG: hypothetical protein V2A34_10190 [Lentisphaerota bacterium]
MRYLLINRFFGGEDVPTGRMLADVALFLRCHGHDVCVLTSKDAYGSRSCHADFLDIKVRLLWTGGGVSRILSWLLFWLGSFFQVVFSKWDRCILLTDPPFLPCMARMATKVRSFFVPRTSLNKIFWWTMDLYPEALVADGMMVESSRKMSFLRGLNEYGLKGLDGVICLGPRQKQRLLKYKAFQLDEAFSTVIPPWDLRSLLCEPARANPLIERFGWQNKKVVLYAGNMGRAHTYSELLQAAAELERRGEDEWVFAFFCRKNHRVQKLEGKARGLKNVVISDYVASNEAGFLLQSAAVHVITMAAGWEGVVVPSKYFGLRSIRSPVLFIGPEDADTAVSIREDCSGICLPTGADVFQVITALKELAGRNWTKSRLRENDSCEKLAHWLEYR